jgi:hypothetical protein
MWFYKWCSRKQFFVFNPLLKWHKMRQKSKYPNALWCENDAYEKQFFIRRQKIRMTCGKEQDGISDAQQSVLWKKVKKPDYDAYGCGEKWAMLRN